METFFGRTRASQSVLKERKSARVDMWREIDLKVARAFIYNQQNNQQDTNRSFKEGNLLHLSIT